MNDAAKDPLDVLAKLLVEGKVKIVRVGNYPGCCPGCGRGTLRSDPTPDWMNRWKCDECGKAVSR